MKVVVAYTHLNPRTVAAVWDSCDELDTIEWADVSGSDSAYYGLLARCWAEREAFVILEHDKVPAQGALRDLHDCERPWCSYPIPMAQYPDRVSDFCTLGCTKFSAELMERWPDLMEKVGMMTMGSARPKHWSRLDACMANQIHRRAGPVHWHPAGMVEHEHLGVSA